MKTNAFKYIFFTIVIFMIGLAVYLLYKDGNNQIYAIGDNELEVNIVRELNIGICNYDTINPILSKNRDVQYIDKLIFEPLLDITNDFKIENGLAEEFSKINDTTYIVKLKDDVYFHDGEKFTSDDVIFTINSLKNNNIDSIYKENVKDIQELQKIDDYTLKIILNQEVEFFEYMMCIPIIAQHSYNENLSSKTEIPIGTGKFKITKIEGNNIIIEKFDSESETKINTINLVLKETAKDLYTSIEKNEIDLMITNNINYEGYIGSIGYNVTQCVGREFDYLILNNKNPILNNKKVRKAINYAIDKNQINYNIYNNKYNICNFPLNYGSYLYNSDVNIEYDLNKAKEMLIEEGWVLKNNIWRKNYRNLNLRLLVEKDKEKRMQVAQNIKEQLEKMGISINIISVNTNQFNNYIKNKNYDIILTGNIISNNPNINTYFNSENMSNFSNEQINNLLLEIKNIDSQEQSLEEKYAKIEEISKEEMPFISLYFNSIFIISNKNLKGDLTGNWYNIFYNIDNWYKIE